jgi:hypothetical protein
MKPYLIAILALLAAPLLWAQSARTADLPQAIQALAASIQDKGPDGVRGEIIKHFGPTHRVVGSGISTEVWDLPEGVLRFNPLMGPTFEDAKSKREHWLLRTRNPVAMNIWRGFEMFTLADPTNHGSQYWLGNLELGPGSTYSFVDSGQFPEHRATVTDKFFWLNPRGTVQVRYMEPIKADTILESVKEGATVARLIFTSADRKHTATYSIVVSPENRHLEFTAEQPIAFAMTAGWRVYWP